MLLLVLGVACIIHRGISRGMYRVGSADPGGGGGGGGTQVQRGPHLRYVFRGRRGLFLRPPHVRDLVKDGYFFVPRYEVWGSKSPYNPRNIRSSDAE